MAEITPLLDPKIWDDAAKEALSPAGFSAYRRASLLSRAAYSEAIAPYWEAYKAVLFEIAEVRKSAVDMARRHLATAKEDALAAYRLSRAVDARKTFDLAVEAAYENYSAAISAAHEAREASVAPARAAYYIAVAPAREICFNARRAAFFSAKDTQA